MPVKLVSIISLLLSKPRLLSKTYILPPLPYIGSIIVISDAMKYAPAPEEAPAAADGFARRLRELDVDALSPMQALMLLCEWKKQAEENG